MEAHAYNAPDIGPREFLIAVKDDLTVAPGLRLDAARKLKQFDRVVRKSLDSVQKSPRELPRRPLDYQPKPRSDEGSAPSPRPMVAITRYEWLFLLKWREYMRETGNPMRADIQRLRDQVLIRKPDPNNPA